MTRQGVQPLRGSVEAGALALQRVLALEGRDVLSRVELAASELARFALAPALAHQIGAIREAVGELDTVLDKIERLADPERPARMAGSTALEPVIATIGARIAPALAARGVALAVAEGGATGAVAVPSAVLERLLLLWLRTALAALPADEGIDGAGPLVLALEGHEDEEAGEIELVLRPRSERAGLRFALERAATVELDVALAEWHGRATRLDEAGLEVLALRLPAGGRSGDV